MITVIYAIPLWWISLWVNICLRLQIFSVMKVDAYYVPRCCLLFLIKLVYESMCGGTCALVGVMQWRRQVSEPGYSLYFFCSMRYMKREEIFLASTLYLLIYHKKTRRKFRKLESASRKIRSATASMAKQSWSIACRNLEIRNWI